MTATKTKARKPETKKPAPTAGETLQLPPGVLPGKEGILAGEVRQIPLDKIDIIAKTDREALTDEQLKIHELAQSIATAGLQQPIRVVPHNNDRYVLVFGERRVRACRLLKHERIAAVVVPQEAKSADTDRSVSEARAVENIQRVDPSPIGEATAIADLFDIKLEEVLAQWRSAQKPQDLKPDQDRLEPSVSRMAGLRAEAIRRTAERIGKPEAWVRDRMFLTGFSGKARDLVSAGRLPLAHAKEIAKVADPKRRDELAQDFAIGGEHALLMSGENQPGPIEDLRQEVARVCFSLSQVPWNLATPFDGKPACEECQFNSLNNPGLFEGKQLFSDDHKSTSKIGRYGGPDERPEPKAGVCLKPTCYQEKATAAGKAVSIAATKALNKFEAAKAAKEKGADKLIGLGEIRLLAPGFISPFVVKERIETRLEDRKAKKTSGSSKRTAPRQRAGDYGTPEYDAKRRAMDQFRVLDHAWEDKKATPAMAAYLAKVPGRWAMWALVCRTKAFEKACSYNAKPKDFGSPELLRALRMVEMPSLSNAIELEKLCGTRFGLFGQYSDDSMNSAFIAHVLHTLGIAVDPPPNEDAMIAAELAKLKKPAAAAKSDKRKPAKKGVVTVGEDIPEEEK